MGGGGGAFYGRRFESNDTPITASDLSGCLRSEEES